MSKITRICDLLDEEFGRREWQQGEPVLDQLVLTILSQNTSAKNCLEAFGQLRTEFADWQEVRQAGWKHIAEAIRAGGLANQKAQRIKRILQEIHSRQDNLDLQWLTDVDDTRAMDYLLAFEGVGRKTAACVMMFALGRNVFPVDTHVHRIAQRLGLIGNVSADAAHDLLQEMVPPERVHSLHVNMISHGRKTCKAVNPLCCECVLQKECDYFGQQPEPR